MPATASPDPSGTPSSPLPTPTPKQQVADQVLPQLSPTEKQTFWEMTQEEWQAIGEKMRGFASTTVGRLPAQDELYLTEQLSEVFGVEITAEKDTLVMPHTVGVAMADRHFKRSPKDTLADHDAVKEAGLAPVRSALGWVTPPEEKFGISLLLDQLPGWNTSDPAQLSAWRQAKFMIINPFHQRSVVCTLRGIGTSEWSRYQFGVSPEIVRGLRLWSPETQGRVLVFIIHGDDANTLPLGVVDWRV